MTLIPTTERTQYCFADCGKEICQCKPSKNIEQKMQTLDEIKQLRAYEMNYVDWEEFIYSIDDPDIVDGEVDNVAKMYALEVAKESLKNASVCNIIYIDTVDEKGEETTGKVIYQDDILSETNIPTEVKRYDTSK